MRFKLDKLWAPWRNKYIYLRKQKRCIFCGNKTKRNIRSVYILDKTVYSFSMLNIYPYNNAHVMVAPFRHVKSIENLTNNELVDLMLLVKKTKKLLDKKMKPHGYNIGMNIGKIGGAGFDGHLHIHIVPRWMGDTNFMPVLANTKVVSDSLGAAYNMLTKP